jgi:hypothetical protein
MTVEPIRVASEWLDLREGADAAARARELVGQLRRYLPASGDLVVHDLACGTGAMGRWLAPRLPGRQRWVGHDRDDDLLGLAALHPPRTGADGAAVEVETRRSDITRLEADDLAGADLITASALLDLLTREEVQGLIDLCTATGSPTLLTLSVVGHVELTPADPLDGRVAAAFDAHQRRMTAGGRLLGPGAVAVAVQAFRRAGSEVLVRPSPWRLAASQAALAAEWFTGWLEAACGQEPGLAAETELYARRRLAAASAGRLVVRVGHADLLAVPAGGATG